MPIGMRSEVLDVIGEGNLSDVVAIVKARMQGLARGKVWQVKGKHRVRTRDLDLHITRLPNFGFGAGLSEQERIAATLRAIPWYSAAECLPGFICSGTTVADENGEILTSAEVDALAKKMPWQIAVIQVNHDRR